MRFIQRFMPGLAAAALAQIASGAVSAAELTRADVESWLDGYMPYALTSGDLAGAVVVVVKDGAVLAAKGYGYADVEARRPVDPQTTLFRPGSTSKLFTWTAVMQQVELGRIDLDADVNRYLDFRIPDFQGQPVTMRQIMTHTAGFEEALSGLIVHTATVPGLDAVVKGWVPKRIFAPGTTPAYSNYATALAGYIVQRVSGEPFDSYIAKHIFEPLGMAHATFAEPLPPNLAADMSKGYAQASSPAKPFEMITVRPAGSASVSGADMARFMISHLDEDHSVLLKPQTMREMHGTALTLMPPLNRMELGFYEANLNGQRIIAHGGDTQWFHSDLWLLPDQHVGMFVSLNSAGREAATLSVREALLTFFMDRYFPYREPASTFQPRVADSAAMAGTYIVSRHSESGVRRALDFFSQMHVTADAGGGLHCGAFEFQGIDGAPRDWVEVAPFLWKDRKSSERLGAQLRDGKVVRIAVDSFAPFMVYDRVPWYRSTTWLRPAAIVSSVTLLLLVLSLPAGWLAR
ncbi:MAG TPA: serine hydrolase domain-containing protein, partial [Steroidobacteraceae bacterium]|nr:serine hydrolase domain-containing protein [Steroidobacteraceae bacterium]